MSWIGGTSFGALVFNFGNTFVRYISPPPSNLEIPDRIEACRTDDPDLVFKGFKIVSYATDPVILIWLGSKDYKAFAATCTHLGCVVGFAKEPEPTIVCNCHGGAFDLQGARKSGPPPRSLQQYRVTVVGGPGKPESIEISKA